MTENIIITPEGGSNGTNIISKNDTKIIGLELVILDEQISLQIVFRHTQAKLSDIVPMARTICSKITDIIVKNAHSKGKQIPCHKCCSACCKTCLVPLSVPEVFRLNEEIQQMPLSRRESIWKDCLAASHRILTHKPPKEFIHQQTEPLADNSAHINLISDWYSSLKLICPFLHKDICSIYEQRPLVCREHYIIGSTEGCKNEDDFAQVLDMPVRVSNSLGQLASELEGTTVEALILPLAILWCNENKKREERTWPLEMMVTRFVEIIKEMAVEDTAVVR